VVPGDAGREVVGTTTRRFRGSMTTCDIISLNPRRIELQGLLRPLSHSLAALLGGDAQFGFQEAYRAWSGSSGAESELARL
jgi:hypothetical protein